MKLKPQFESLSHYIEASEIIDFGRGTSCEIAKLAHDIFLYSSNKVDFIKNAFEYVRDKIHHSADISGKVVTCKASEVLKAGEGICYAKSHLLAALLRCNLIPTGFCYQRLILDEDEANYCIIHGLNAVYIEEFGKWIRLDARGNKPSVNAQFSFAEEKLAFLVRTEKR